MAGLTQDGSLIRLFPVPFRLISDDQQFKKWQWIKARIAKAPADHRRESHKIYVDTIQVEGKPIPPTKQWRDRLPYLQRLRVLDDFGEAERERSLDEGPTLAFVRPKRIVSLDISPVANPTWTDEERAKLLAHQQQAGLFDDSDARAFRTLKKLPYDFHYRYICDTGRGEMEYRHKISDWEAGALFWNCKLKYGRAWEEPFRAKFETALPLADLIFLMGTIHRFPDKWLIVSLIYPPKRPVTDVLQDQVLLFPL